jgi:hypothetical protein
MMDQDRAKVLLMHRTEGVSTRRIIRKSARHYVCSTLVAFAILTGVLTYKDVRIKLYFMAVFGVCCGALARDTVQLFRMKKDWRFTSRIIDWSKVEAISEGNETANDASVTKSREISEPAEVVAARGLTMIPSDLTLQQLLVAGMGFVPLLGLPFAIFAIAWGLLIRKRCGAKLVIFGTAGPILSSALFVGIAFVGSMIFYGPSAKERTNKFLAPRLMGVGEEIEAFKKASGRYPAKLNEMAQSPRYLLAYDPFQSTQVTKGYTKQPTFYYQRLSDPSGYYLFSVGEDGKPFTSDDMLPAPSNALPGLRLPSKPR